MSDSQRRLLIILVALILISVVIGLAGSIRAARRSRAAAADAESQLTNRHLARSPMQEYERTRAEQFQRGTIWSGKR